MTEKEMCSVRTYISGYGKSTLHWIYGKTLNISCLCVGAKENISQSSVVTDAARLVPKREQAPAVVDELTRQ
jgi:hypothetical protein